MLFILFILLIYSFERGRAQAGWAAAVQFHDPTSLQTLRGSSVEIDYFYRLQHIKYSEWQLCEDFCQESSLLQAQI